MFAFIHDNNITIQFLIIPKVEIRVAYFLNDLVFSLFMLILMLELMHHFILCCEQVLPFEPVVSSISAYGPIPTVVPAATAIMYTVSALRSSHSIFVKSVSPVVIILPALVVNL